MVEVHYVAGLLALLAGFVALFSPKGSRLHRRSGRLFVIAMVAMLGLAAAMAFFFVDEPGNGLGALLTIYLVITSLLTVTRRVDETRGLTTGLAAFAFGIGGLALAEGSLLVVPIALACGVADLRMLRRGSIAGPQRLIRHLWRMTFALWVATASFFLGQAKVIPEPARNFALLSIPVLAVLAMLLYWLWRINLKKSGAAAAAEGRVR
jgi:uncharacterized membrane protein